MATDHRLEVVLAARDATQKAFKTATARIDGYRKKIVNMRTVMVGAAGAAGIGYFVKKQLESADATAKAADAIGVSTKALQEYRFIADRSGVATGTLEQGLGAFTKRLGELKSGTGALNTLLNKNNQALAEQLKQAESTDAALRIYLDALGQIEDQSEKAALSAAGFSRTAGIKMTNMVKDGTEGLDQMRRRFEELGGGIEDRFLRQSEAAIDAITDLETSVTNSLTTMVVQSAPEIEKLVGRMTEWVVQNREILAQDVPDKIGEISKSVKEFVDVVKQIPDPILYGGLGAVFGGKWGAAAGAAAGSVAVAIDKSVEATPGVSSFKELTLLRKEIEKTETSWRDYFQMTEDAQRAFIERLVRINEIAEDSEGFDARLARFAKEAKESTAATAKNIGEVTVSAERLIRTISPKTAKPEALGGVISPEMLKEAKDLIADMRTPLEVLKDQLGDINKLYDAGLVDQQTYMRAIQFVGEASVEAGDAARDAAGEAEAALKRAAENIQDAWAGLLSNVLQGETVKIESIVSDLGGTLADTVSNSIVAGFTEGFGGAEGGGLLDSLMAGITGGLSTGNLALAGASAGMSLLGGVLGDDEPSWWDKFRDSMQELRDELNEQTEATRANTRAMLDASPGEEFRTFLSSTEGQGRSLMEEFRFPEGDLFGRNAAYMQDFLGSMQTFGPEGQESIYNIFKQMSEGNMSGIWPQEMRDQILDQLTGRTVESNAGHVLGYDSTSYISADEMREMTQRYWDQLGKINKELAETAVAKLEEMLAGMQQELVQTTQGLDKSLTSWADKLDEFRGVTTEYDKMQREYNQGVAADLARIKELAAIEGVEFSEIRDQLFEDLPYDSIAEMEAAVENLGVAIDEHFNQKIAETIGNASRYVGELTGEITPLEKEMHALDQRFERWRESLVQANAGQEALNQLSDQRAEAEEYLRQQYADSTAAAIEYANAMSAADIRMRQAQIGGTADRFRLQQAMQSLDLDPSMRAVKDIVAQATSASASEIRDLAASLGLSTEAYLDNVGTLDNALDSLSDSTEDVASSSERAADALRNQVDALQSQISAVESLEDLLNNIRGGGDLAPVQSMEFFENRYDQLLQQAQSGGQREVENLTQFARKYLDFAQDFGGYAGVASTVEQDLATLQDDISGGRTLEDLYDQLTRTNAELERVKINTAQTAQGIADAIGEALEDITDGGGDDGGGLGIDPWDAAGWNMDSLLENFKKGMETGIENMGRGFELLEGEAGEGSGINVAQRPNGQYEAAYYGEGQDYLGRVIFDEIDNITEQMLWNLAQQSEEIKNQWKQYWPGGASWDWDSSSFADGGTVSGPSSGYTIPTTFHSTEHIIPEEKMARIIERVAERTMTTTGRSGNVRVDVRIGERELRDITVDVLEDDPEAQYQIRRVANG